MLSVRYSRSGIASASSIRNVDFDLRPKTSPNDILRVVPGLLAVQHQGGGKADQLFLRGFDADHGTDVAVFVDGVESSRETYAVATMPGTAQPVQIGKRPSTADTFVGLTDDVRIYSRALSPAEIAELAK